MVGMHRDRECSAELKEKIRGWGRELGFDAIGFAAADLTDGAQGLNAWLAAGCHGEMDYMAAHVTGKGHKRAQPTELVPGTRSIITARINYLPATAIADGVVSRSAADAAAGGARAFVARYARGRDYHRLLRRRLQKLAERISAEIGSFCFRVFTDSAPVMEVALAQHSGLGWRGKNTLLLDRDTGSYFFLGEIFTDLHLAPDPPTTDHCGTCTACIGACPSAAIVAPDRLDARLCVSYLTIELKGSIPEALRPLMGNRIYGCDDCQTVCPWNRFAPFSREPDFAPRQGLDRATLVELFAWDETDFNRRLAGSPIRRIGFERWLRNIAVALGNGPRSELAVAALHARADHPSAMVREHVAWALNQHRHNAVR